MPAEHAAQGDIDLGNDMVESVENCRIWRDTPYESGCLQAPRNEIKNRFESKTHICGSSWQECVQRHNQIDVWRYGCWYRDTSYDTVHLLIRNCAWLTRNENYYNLWNASPVLNPLRGRKIISMFGITVVLYFVKIFSGSRNYQMLRGQNKLLSSSWVGWTKGE